MNLMILRVIIWQKELLESFENNLVDCKVSSKKSFIFLSRIRFKSLSLYQLYMIMLAVSLLVAIINNYCQYIYILEQDQLFLFLSKDRVLYLIRETDSISNIKYYSPIH